MHHADITSDKRESQGSETKKSSESTPLRGQPKEPLIIYQTNSKLKDMNTADINLAFAKELDTLSQEILFGKLIEIGLVQYIIAED